MRQAIPVALPRGRWLNRLSFAFVLALLGLCAFVPPSWAQSEPFTSQTAQKLAQGSFREYLELLSMPKNAIVPSE